MILNSIRLFKEFSINMVNNNINLQLMINLADKFLFSVFKLLNKVRFLYLIYII